MTKIHLLYFFLKSCKSVELISRFKAEDESEAKVWTEVEGDAKT